MERKEHRSGRCLRTEPEGLDITLREEEVAKAFRSAGCWRFCEKLRGGHEEVTRAFALNFTGMSTKVAMLEFAVSPEVISNVTEIPRSGEEWFKNFKFEMGPCKEFLKPPHANEDLTKAIPRSHLKENYAQLLTCIQKYLTCEGRYNKVYSYHFKLLLHFTGKVSIDIPFYLFRSVSKMCDKVQFKKDAWETSLFHHGLVKLLVLDSLQKVGKDWDSFVFMAGFSIKTGLTPLPVREKESRSEEPTLAELRRKVTDHTKPKIKAKRSEKSVVAQETPESSMREIPKSSKPSERKTPKPAPLETPQSSKKRISKRKEVATPTEVDRVSRVKTRGQLSKEKEKLAPVEESPFSKGSLNDLLEAIEMEQDHPIQVEPLESEQDQVVPPMHIDLTQSSPENSKKSTVSKKLKFEEPSEEYVFKPRRPLTRRQNKELEKAQKGKAHSEIPRSEALENLSEMVQTAKGKNRDKRVTISQSTNVTAIKRQVGATKEKTPQMKKVFREKAVRYANYRKAVLAGRTNWISQADTVSDAYMWTVPALKQVKTMKQINIKLRAENKRLKQEVNSLKGKLGKLAK